MQCFLNDHIADAPELLLLGERQTLARPLIVVQAHLLVERLPRFIGGGHPLILRQLLHDGIHDGLCPWRQVAVDLSALDRHQAFRQLLGELLQTRVIRCAMLQLRDALHHCLASLRLQLLPRGILLLVDVHPIRVVDPSGEGGLHLPDAFFGEIALARIGREHDHVNMHLIRLLVERSIPTQVFRSDLIRLCDITDGGVHQSLPVFRVVIAQPLCVLTAQRHHRCPYISGVLRHLPYRLREIFYLTVGIPQPVLAVLLDAGTMGDVVDKIFLLLQRLHVVFLHLLNERRGAALGGVIQIFLVLNELPAGGEGLQQPRDKIPLLFCGGECTALIRQQLHAGTGSDIASTLGQLRGVLSALEVGGNQYDPGHSSSGSMRRC